MNATPDDRLAEIEKQLKTNDGSTLRDEVVETRVLAEEARDLARSIAADRGMTPVGLDPTERPPT